MAIVNAKEILLKARTGRYAVGAFNVSDLVQMEAVVEVAAELGAPVIIQTSVMPSRFLGMDVITAVYRTLATKYRIPVCLHLDHCTDVEYCKACSKAGYTNIMIDASKQVFEENVRQTRAVCEYAHHLGDITVEGELGTVAGVEEQVKVVENEAMLCDPDIAVRFVERTGVDLFAPAIGTAHGVYKTADPKIDLYRLQKIRDSLESKGLTVPLVIHGGTGLPAHTVRRLIDLGGAKFNISTELKHILIDTTFDYIQTHRDEYDPGRIDKEVKEAIKRVVGAWIQLLGCAGKAE